MDLTAAIWAGMMEKVDLEQGSLRWPDGRSLVLQLSLRTGFALMPLPVTVLGHGLMDAPPQ